MEMFDRIPRKVALALRSALQIEYPDKTPVEIPERYLNPPSLEDRLRSFIRGELSQAARESGFGTEQEENDLSFEDEEEYLSSYQVKEMAEEFLLAEPSAEEQDSESGADSAPEGGPLVAGEENVEEPSEAPPASKPPPG